MVPKSRLGFLKTLIHFDSLDTLTRYRNEENLTALIKCGILIQKDVSLGKVNNCE